MEVFNGNFDKVDIEDLTPGLKKRILESSDLITYDLNRHIADKKVHISAVDRNNWDSKAPNDSPNFTGVPQHQHLLRVMLVKNWQQQTL